MFCPNQGLLKGQRLATDDPVCMGRESCQYNCIPVLKYSGTGMTFCPYRLDQMLVQWPVDESQQNHIANLYPSNNLWFASSKTKF